MKRYLWLPVLMLAGILCSCSKVELAGITDVVYIDTPMSYTGLEVGSAIEVRLSEDCTAPQLEADVNLIPYVEIYERKGILNIELANGLKLQGDGWNAAKVVVSLPARSDIRSVSLSGASTFVSDLPVEEEKFSLTLSGASRFTGSVNAESVDIDLSGASMMECGYIRSDRMNMELSRASLARLSGRTSFCEIDLSGASSLSGISELQKYSFRVDECTGELSGASSAMFVCDGRITCSLSGASLLSYMGDADTSGSYTSGGSEIIGCRY